MNSETTYPPDHISYQLHIRLHQNIQIVAGALGSCNFVAGDYVYTGSAKRNLAARIRRHLAEEKKLRWHIDYLLAHPAAEIVSVETSAIPECQWNQQLPGVVPVRGFGASDCHRHCGSHLKKI
ncbi:MAG TPA: GIY-YIG nuclease family protein [Chromatiaceae bacterium]|nr:GIY-YIG nuclease family protein [Chromatiaceae bacterium]